MHYHHHHHHLVGLGSRKKAAARSLSTALLLDTMQHMLELQGYQVAQVLPSTLR